MGFKPLEGTQYSPPTGGSKIASGHGATFFFCAGAGIDLATPEEKRRQETHYHGVLILGDVNFGLVWGGYFCKQEIENVSG